MKATTQAGLVFCACAVFATANAEIIEETIITGTRMELATGKLAASTTIIDRQAIETLQLQDLPELLQGVPGVDVTMSGGYGKTADFRLRGTESDHVLVLIDGVRIGSATTGTAALQFIPTSQIERMEIVRGPRSSVWGSDALGGVMHIITRKGAGEPRYGMELTGGSNDTYSVTGNASGATGDFNYSGTISYFDTAGINARQPVTGFFGFNQPDADGYHNLSVHLRGGYAFSDRADMEAFILRAEGATEFDGSFEDKTDFLQQVVGIQGNVSPAANWISRLSLSRSDDNADNFDLADALSSTFDTRRLQLAWQNEISIDEDHEINLGLDYRDDEIDGTTTYAESSRDNLGVYGQYSGDWQGHHLIASVRHDEDETFGGETTGSVGWSHLWQDWLKLYAAFGTAYKTPTFNELYYPGFGNPDLGPESAISYEGGLEGDHDWLRWGLHAYRTDLEDLIVTVANPLALWGFSPENVGEARIIGLEGDIAVTWEGWTAMLAGEVLDHEDESTGNRLPRRADERLRFDLQKDFDRWSVGGSVRAEGNRYDDAGNTIPVDGFVTVDLRGEFRVTDQIAFGARAANLFDEEYETNNGFNSLGRNFMLTLRYRNR